jgi:hypothetical protein
MDHELWIIREPRLRRGKRPDAKLTNNCQSFNKIIHDPWIMNYG